MTTNVTLEGLDLYAEGTEYAIHDDVWRHDEPYVNEYRHCKVVGRRLFGANCIGGGVAKNARIIIDNCFFDNGVPCSATVRYHNTDYENARSEIWVSNSFFNAKFAGTYYGTSARLDIYVNNSKAEGFVVIPETPDSEIENVYLYVWNNQ